MTLVRARVYDISSGVAQRLSPLVLGKRIEGVWHTGVHVFGYEYFYSAGIEKMTPEHVAREFSMEPWDVLDMGDTLRSKREFEGWLLSIRKYFNTDQYDLATWNCNHFADLCIKFLLPDCDGLPSGIVALPQEVRSSAIGRVMFGMVDRYLRGENPFQLRVDRSQSETDESDDSNYWMSSGQALKTAQAVRPQSARAYDVPKFINYRRLLQRTPVDQDVKWHEKGGNRKNCCCSSPNQGMCGVPIFTSSKTKRRRGDLTTLHPESLIL